MIEKLPNNMDEVEAHRAVPDSFGGLGWYKIPCGSFLFFERKPTFMSITP